mgnify:CR=1 FL=1
MKKINLAITGCLGRMGQQLIKSSKLDKNFKLVAITENQFIKKRFPNIYNKCLNFNIDMDMTPWNRINPCGLGVQMTQLADLVKPSPSKQQVIDKLAELLQLALGYNTHQLGSQSILA